MATSENCPTSELLRARAVGLDVLSRQSPQGDLNLPEWQAAGIWECLTEIQTELNRRLEGLTGEARAEALRERYRPRPGHGQGEVEDLLRERRNALDFLEGLDPMDEQEQMLQETLEETIEGIDARLAKELH